MERFEGAKYDNDKPRYSRVPPEVLDAIEAVRAYGCAKYKESEDWKSISADRWHEALLRHVREIWDDPCHVDEESRLPSLWHIATNVAFLCASLRGELSDRAFVEEKNEHD